MVVVSCMSDLIHGLISTNDFTYSMYGLGFSVRVRQGSQ